MVMFSLGVLTGITIVFVGSLIYAKRQPRKVAESLMKFELYTDEQTVARLNEKIKNFKQNEG